MQNFNNMKKFKRTSCVAASSVTADIVPSVRIQCVSLPQCIQAYIISAKSIIYDFISILPCLIYITHDWLIGCVFNYILALSFTFCFIIICSVLVGPICGRVTCCGLLLWNRIVQKFLSKLFWFSSVSVQRFINEEDTLTSFRTIN